MFHRLELHSPFGYLRDISKEVANKRECSTRLEKQKADDNIGLCSGSSDSFLSCGEDWTTIEQSTKSSTSEFLYKLAFPQRDRVSRFSTHHS